jgi:hypothetical protein
MSNADRVGLRAEMGTRLHRHINTHENNLHVQVVPTDHHRQVIAQLMPGYTLAFACSRHGIKANVGPACVLSKLRLGNGLPNLMWPDALS